MAWRSLSKVKGLNEFLIQTLYNHSVRSAEDLITAERDFLLQFPGMTPELLDEIVADAARVAQEERIEAERLRADADRAARAAEAGRELQRILNMDADSRLRSVRGVGDTTLAELKDAGFPTVELIAEAEILDLATKIGISDKKAKQLKYAATQWLKHETETRTTAEELGVVVHNGIVQAKGASEDLGPATEAIPATLDQTTQAEVGG